MTMRFRVLGGDRSIDVAVRRVLIAGFTGRDTDSVSAHIGELRALGVPVPEEVPILVELPAELLVCAERIHVEGEFTSGEVEAVVVVHEGRRWLTVGSDHTDRDIERVSIAASKAACVKVVGHEVMPIDEIADLDNVEIESWADDDGQPYQRGTLAEILPLRDIENMLQREGKQLADGDVLFLGSLPVTGGKLRPAASFRAVLREPDSDSRIAIRYDVQHDVGGQSDGKPELEFTAVDSFEWTTVDPRIPGQTERILARHGDTSIATRMLRFEPGTDTRELGALAHDFWEEVYILSGSLHDLALDQTFRAGAYACRPPGMLHGPWVAPDGCVTFEVRYPASDEHV